MALTVGEWAAVHAIAAVHCINPALIAAVKTELDAARATAISESGTATRTDTIGSTT